MDKDQVRNKLEQLFLEVFQNDPVSTHLHNIEALMTYGWDDEIAQEYFEELKAKLI